MKEPERPIDPPEANYDIGSHNPEPDESIVNAFAHGALSALDRIDAAHDRMIARLEALDQSSKRDAAITSVIELLQDLKDEAQSSYDYADDTGADAIIDLLPHFSEIDECVAALQDVRSDEI